MKENEVKSTISEETHHSSKLLLMMSRCCNLSLQIVLWI